jgi:hypothetical protein
MSYQVPGMLGDDGPADRGVARTEVLARGFADAAGEFFERRKRYEDAIDEAEEQKRRMKLIGAGGVAVGVALLVFGAIGGGSPSLPLIAIGVAVAAGTGLFAYTKFQDAVERIDENRRNIAENEPDGEVTFVSQVAVPFYLVPYQDQFMIFDGLNQAPETRLELANIDGDALTEEGAQLEELIDTYESELAGASVVSPGFAEQFAPAVAEHGQLERPLLDQLDTMTDIASDVSHETVEVNVHANDVKSGSMRTFAQRGRFMEGSDLPTVPTQRSAAESETAVGEIRGVEQEAVSGDLLSQAREQRRFVNETATGFAERLQSNEEEVTDHYDEYADGVDAAVHRHVCADCLSERVEALDNRLDLVSEILSSETGSLGAALSDQDLNLGYDGEFTETIRNDIQREIPALSSELKRAFTSLPELGGDDGHCEIHGDVETVRVPDSGPIFGETWRSLYHAFREPIMESAADLERDAEEVRQNKEQKMIDMTQYEQIKERAERDFHQVKSDYEAAAAVERRLR